MLKQMCLWGCASEPSRISSSNQSPRMWEPFILKYFKKSSGWDDFKVVASPQIISGKVLKVKELKDSQWDSFDLFWGLKHIDDTKTRAQKLLEHLTTELHVPKPNHGLPWAVGKTLVFFKLPAFERIKFARLELLVKSATQIQAAWRRRVQMGKYKARTLCLKHFTWFHLKKKFIDKKWYIRSII